MIDPLHARLAENQRVIEAATEGPWIVDPDDPAYVIKPDDVSGFDGYAVCALTEHDGDLFPVEHNGAFIAAARTELPRLNAALRAVLELHKPDEDGEECAVCMNQEGDPRPYPCPTVQAIQEAMSDDSDIDT